MANKARIPEYPTESIPAALCVWDDVGTVVGLLVCVAVPIEELPVLVVPSSGTMTASRLWNVL